jgi:hypothetical protein
MSSTNRSNIRHNHQYDYYVTPHKPIYDFFNKLKEVGDFNYLFSNDKLNNNLVFLDPCAGGDNINQMSYPTVIQSLGGGRILTNDIRKDSLADNNLDFLTTDLFDNKADIIITNPPFNLSLEFIQKSLDIVKPDGLVIMLLRLNYFGSKNRKPFFDKNMPVACFVHHKRISFFGGKTDSIEYAHFIWKKGNNPSFTKLFLI